MFSNIKPEFFSIKMFPSVPLQSAEKLNPILDVFESREKFVPMKWGNLETIRVDYNRAEIIEKVSTGQPGFTEVYLHRRQSIKYTGRFSVYSSFRSFLDFEFDKSMPQKWWAEFFQMSDEIAAIAQPRYGSTHIFFPDPDPWESERERQYLWMNYAAYAIPVELIPNGPLGLGMRTYFSGDILDLFGRDIFRNAPAIVTELDWGGIRIDLVERPWEVDMDTILEQWIKMMEHLEVAQVIAIPRFHKNRSSVSFRPNIGWENRRRT